MGRPSKLTPEQWEQIHRRLIKGEKPADLSREFGISKTRISERFAGRFETVKAVANQMLAAETAFQALPITEQIETVSVLNDLRAMSKHLGAAGKFSAATSHRIAAIANAQAERIDDADPTTGDSMNALRTIAALTDLANKAAVIPSAILAANKDTVKDMNQQAKPLPARVTVAVEDASMPDA